MVLCLLPAVACGFSAGSPFVPRTRAAVRMAAGDGVLIVQNKGGGHGEIGYHLALQLAKEKGQDVTILHEGPNKGKPPHNAYGDLDAAGVKVIWCDSLDDSSACIEALGGAQFGAVVDNWSKSPEQIKPYAALAQSMDVTNYCYISSAGMYKPSSDDIVPETTECKLTGQREAELLLSEMKLPFSYFRPQYIYGPKQGKSYLAYFFDRCARRAPPDVGRAYGRSASPPLGPCEAAPLAHSGLALALRRRRRAPPRAAASRAGSRCSSPTRATSA